MAVKRLPRYPKPFTLDTLEDVKTYIVKLHQSLEQEGTLRLQDFQETEAAG